MGKHLVVGWGGAVRAEGQGWGGCVDPAQMGTLELGTAWVQLICIQESTVATSVCT